MSHAWGCVHLVPSGEIVGWYEYNGTGDVACSAIQPTYDDVCRLWRTAENHRECTCGVRVEVPVRLWSDYGNGFGWLSLACLTCGVILGPFSEEDAEDMGCHDAEPHVARRCDAALAAFWKARRENSPKMLGAST